MKDYSFFSDEENIIFKRFLLEITSSAIEKLIIINKEDLIQVIIYTGGTKVTYQHKIK